MSGMHRNMGYDITILSQNQIYNQFLTDIAEYRICKKSAKMMTLEPDEQELLISCPLGALPTIIIPAPSSSFRLTRSFNALMKGSASMALKSRADFFLLMFSWLMTISLAEIIGSSGEHHFPKIEKGSPGDPG